MNREHWKKVLPFVQAYAEGKMLMYKGMTANGTFTGDPNGYSIESPRKSPWTQADVPMVAQYRVKGRVDVMNLIRFNHEGMTFWRSWTYEEAMTQLEYRTQRDGVVTDWMPCAKEVA